MASLTIRDLPERLLDSLKSRVDWKPVSTNEVTAPAPGEQGFFIVAPQGK